MCADRQVVGWDVGGVSLKAALAVGGEIRAFRSLPLSIQHEFDRLGDALRALHGGLGAPADAPHAVTMTAELSQRFRTKAEGVSAVLGTIVRAFPGADVWVYTVDGTFVTPAEAIARPLDAAASNWMATASLVARWEPTALLIDTGTTTTDVIPIVGGRVVALGRTDPARLASGELVYTGAVRTPVEAIVAAVPYAGGAAAVAADGFALVGDVHLWRGALAPEAYEAPTPDGRPATREYAGERLARVICADRLMLTDAEIDAIATAVAEAQLAQIMTGILRVRSRWPELGRAVVTGVGEFIAADAARRSGLAVGRLSDRLGGAARIAPAAAVALLLSRQVGFP